MRSALPAAVGSVLLIYVLVALGAAALVGADTLIEQKEIALAAAGKAAAGTVGLVVITVAAVFSTASAINATLFATARLARDVASDGQLPELLGRHNDSGVPFVAVLVLGAGAGVLAVIGGLAVLVQAASLVFLATFTAVCFVAWSQRVNRRALMAAGWLLAGFCTVTLTVRLALDAPVTLLALAITVAAALIARPLVTRHPGS